MEFPINNVEIERVFSSDKKQDGTLYVSSKGQPFKKVDIYVSANAIDDSEFTGKMSYFDYYDKTAGWQQGTRITGKIIKNGQWFNFEFPPSATRQAVEEVSGLKERVEELQKNQVDMIRRIITIEKELNIYNATAEVKSEATTQDAIEFTKEALKEDKIDDDDLPF
jgi:hypothetical protein